ncbi:hypothetical protein POM88_043389 [Heracleum sosnowskyi]|uniref:Uncharacterized protein n=1 Tax=Heracleum sosnowskyi TaxID=360622 RepID=A0AAD8H3E1_9APIA|nr:hypothetical protein POM88_043389 [Heracleum sosnowskyi]
MVNQEIASPGDCITRLDSVLSDVRRLSVIILTLKCLVMFLSRVCNLKLMRPHHLLCTLSSIQIRYLLRRVDSFGMESLSGDKANYRLSSKLRLNNTGHGEMPHMTPLLPAQ